MFVITAVRHSGATRLVVPDKADLLERFGEDYRALARLVDRLLPDERALKYADRLARLTKARAYARATYLREDAAVDWARDLGQSEEADRRSL